jgi:hypothetical protein
VLLRDVSSRGVALADAGFLRDTWSHAALQATFTTQLIHRRKLYPRSLSPYLNRTLFWRNIADYADTDMSQRRARQLVAWAQAFVTAVEEITGYESPSSYPTGQSKH